MKIAVVGSGGREHAILWRLRRDPEVHELLAVPGNGGTLSVARSIPADLRNTNDLVKILQREAPDLVVVGPEALLAAGIADELDRVGIRCFGPGAAAARIESSKVFAKRRMALINVPTAEFAVLDDYASLERYVKNRAFGEGWVVKADGLAAGKGAFVCDSIDIVLSCGHALLVEHALGKAGSTVVLERRLMGREVSALFLCDGEHAVLLPPAQDYKRVGEGDTGPNTGGMGSYCPAQHLTSEFADEVRTRIVLPVLTSLAEEGSVYRGVLYVGLMLTENGPQVIEFNCRFGDPETQVILPVISDSLSNLLLKCAEGSLPADRDLPALGSAVCIVLAARGYPGDYLRNIRLKEEYDTDAFVTFHAGTARKADGLLSSGGRVLNAVGLGTTIPVARSNAYSLANALLVDGLCFRSDIAIAG